MRFFELSICLSWNMNSEWSSWNPIIWIICNTKKKVNIQFYNASHDNGSNLRNDFFKNGWVIMFDKCWMGKKCAKILNNFYDWLYGVKVISVQYFIDTTPNNIWQYVTDFNKLVTRSVLHVLAITYVMF